MEKKNKYEANLWKIYNKLVTDVKKGNAENDKDMKKE